MFPILFPCVYVITLKYFVRKPYNTDFSFRKIPTWRQCSLIYVKKKIRSRPKNLFEKFDVGEQPTPIVCFVKETHRYDENVTNNRKVFGLSVTI